MNRDEALKEIDDHLDFLADYHREDRDTQAREIDGATYRALRKSRILIEKIYDSLEAPKSCSGCKHFFKDDFAGCKLYEKDFTRCSRQFESDYYEPKEKE